MLVRANLILLIVRLSLEYSEYGSSGSDSDNSNSNEVVRNVDDKMPMKSKPSRFFRDEDGEDWHIVKVWSTSENPIASSDEDVGSVTLDTKTVTLADDFVEEEEEKQITTEVARRFHKEAVFSTSMDEEMTTVLPPNQSLPNIKDCKELYPAHLAGEKGYAQMTRPFAVSIHKKGAFYATGALLDHSWILTSAGDFYNVRESTRLFKARLGSFDCKRGGTLVPIKSIYIHPQFVQGLPSFDVALLQIAEPVEYSCTVMPTPLATTRAGVVKARFMVTYWPKLIVKGSPLPLNARERFKHQHMRVTLQSLMPWDECFKRLKAIGVKLSESSLCLQPIYSHHSPCLPDNGAPVMAPDKLWGVTSGWTSPNCSRSQSPTVITRVSSPEVRVWLDAHVQSLR